MELGFGKEDLNSFEKLRLVFPCRLPIRMPSMAQYRTYNGYCGAGKTIQSGTLDAVNLAAGETKELTVKVELRLFNSRAW